MNSSSDAVQADDLDSERYGGDVTLTHDISSASNMYLLVEAQQIDFKDDTALDYDSNLAYLGYRLGGSRTTLHVAIGYTEIGGDSPATGGWIGL